MIHYPIISMTNARIKDIMIISGTGHVGDIIGRKWSRRLILLLGAKMKMDSWCIKGFANFVGNDSALSLGDNIFEESI